jgi:hypothetical protein
MTIAITVRAVMAFSSLALATMAFAREDKPAMTPVGAVEPCTKEDWGALPAITDPDTKLLAAFGQVEIKTWWVRVLQRGQRFTVESTRPPATTRTLDPKLAQAIALQMSADIAKNAFILEREVSDEIYVDMPWSIFSADGKSCATMNLMDGNETAARWSEVFLALAGHGSRRDTLAWSWLDRLGARHATLPTLLSDLSSGRDAVGEPSAWKHPGAQPLAILNHRARFDHHDLVILGEVANRMDAAQDRVQVVATFFDADGRVLGTKADEVAFTIIPSGARSPFELRATALNIAAYTVSVEPGIEVELRPETLHIADHRSRNDDDELVVTGNVRNDGGSAEQFLSVVVGLYDSADRLLRVDDDLVPALPAGASAPFEVSIERPRGYHHYKVQVNPAYREKHSDE